MFGIERYRSEYRESWDSFVRSSRNYSFLFLRDYMEYHEERFCDHSLLFLDTKGDIVALLPANEVLNEGKKELHSHQGLTYGGLILSLKNTAEGVMEMFDDLVEYMKANDFSCLLYTSPSPRDS